MAEIHALVARIVLVLVIVIAAWSVVLVVSHRPVGAALAAGVAWVVIMVAASGLFGIVTAILGGPPSDPLHIVYGVLAALVLPGAWAIARTRAEPQRTAVILAVASVVQVILVIRLFQTGG